MLSLFKSYPKYKWMLAILDGLVLNIAFAATIIVCRQRAYTGIHDDVFIFSLISSSFFLYSLLCIVYFQYCNLYKVQTALYIRENLFVFFKTIFFVTLGFVLFQFFVIHRDFIDSRLFFVIFFCISFPLLLLTRYLFIKTFMNNVKMLDRAVIIGAGDKGKALEIAFEKSGVRKVIGFIDDNLPVGTVNGLRILGKTTDASVILKKYKIDRFILAVDNIERERFFEIFTFFEQYNLPLSVSSAYLKVLNDNLHFDSFEDMDVVRFSFHGKNNFVRGYKRIFDLIATTIGIILLSPVFIILGALVLLSSKGPVIYKQIRIGKDGEPFAFYKFRSMYVNSDKDETRAKAVEDFIKGQKTDSNCSTKIVNKSKITPIGRILRKYSLDELPQLFNVLNGTMSLVGPRPCLVNEWDVYEDWQKLRLDSVPGCTGLWQVSGRSKVDFEESVLMDIYYNHNHTPWLDLQIILNTIPIMVFGKGGE